MFKYGGDRCPTVRENILKLIMMLQKLGLCIFVLHFQLYFYIYVLSVNLIS